MAKKLEVYAWGRFKESRRKGSKVDSIGRVDILQAIAIVRRSVSVVINEENLDLFIITCFR